jgi:hypothetical protein
MYIAIYTWMVKINIYKSLECFTNYIPLVHFHDIQSTSKVPILLWLVSDFFMTFSWWNVYIPFFVF